MRKKGWGMRDEMGAWCGAERSLRPTFARQRLRLETSGLISEKMTTENGVNGWVG